jgi:hypothetical protein
MVILAALTLRGEVFAARDAGVTGRSPDAQAGSASLLRAVTDGARTTPRAELRQPSSASTVFRDVPSITGRYSIGGKTILPYVGAGFGGGYSSDVDRHMGSAAPVPGEPRMGSQFGQGISPNEFQMGVRIPF